MLSIYTQFIECVNDVTYSWNYVTVLILKDCTFVFELLFVINTKYGIAKDSVFLKY